MRTATITAVTHDKKDVLVCGKTTPLIEQIKTFKQFRLRAAADGSHDQFAAVYFQESDGPEQIVRFNSPDRQKELDERKKKADAAFQAAQKKQQKEEAASAAAWKSAATK